MDLSKLNENELLDYAHLCRLRIDYLEEHIGEYRNREKNLTDLNEAKTIFDNIQAEIGNRIKKIQKQ